MNDDMLTKGGRVMLSAMTAYPPATTFVLGLGVGYVWCYRKHVASTVMDFLEADPAPAARELPGDQARPNKGWIATITGAKEGEGYFPDSWGVFGSRQAAKEALKEGVVTTGKAVGTGIGAGAGEVADRTLPKWLIPTVALGSMGLAGMYIWRSTR